MSTIIPSPYLWTWWDIEPAADGNGYVFVPCSVGPYDSWDEAVAELRRSGYELTNLEEISEFGDTQWRRDDGRMVGLFAKPVSWFE